MLKRSTSTLQHVGSLNIHDKTVKVLLRTSSDSNLRGHSISISTRGDKDEIIERIRNALTDGPKQLTSPWSNSISNEYYKWVDALEDISSDQGRSNDRFKAESFGMLEEKHKRILFRFCVCDPEVEIKKRDLTYWSIGEGFMSDPNELLKYDRKTPHLLDEFDEKGEDHLETLLEKLVKGGFIEHVVDIKKKKGHTTRYTMSKHVWSEVRKHLFLPQGSHCGCQPNSCCSSWAEKVCLLKMVPMNNHDDSSPLKPLNDAGPEYSAVLWQKNKIPKVQILFNQDRFILDMKRNWILGLKDVQVLHLGIRSCLDHKGWPQYVEAKHDDDYSNVEQRQVEAKDIIQHLDVNDNGTPQHVMAKDTVQPLDENDNGSPQYVDDVKDTIQPLDNDDKNPKQQLGQEAKDTIQPLTGNNVNKKQQLKGDDSKRQQQKGNYKGKKYHIEAKDIKELFKDITGLKKVRFLSLQGVSGILELPDSVCKLRNLKVLDLRACHNLELLPKKMRLLRNLTHLDLSGCLLLDHLHKGIASLTELRVLKGFVISDRKKHSSCAFSDLCKLVNLEELSVHSKRKIFPTEEDLDTIGALQKLLKLKILWGGPSKVRHSSSQTWPRDGFEPRPWQPKIKKLELQAAPQQAVSLLLSPQNLKCLEKLYITGGHVCDLGQGKKNKLDAVRIVRLKYLAKLQMDWRQFMALFPHTTYLQMFQCPKLALFPCDGAGVWAKSDPEKP